MKKLLLAILINILTQNIFAYEYNELLLKAQINIFPKLLLFDKDLKEETQQNTIILTVVYDKSDTYKASIIRRLIEERYQTLNNFNVTVLLKEYNSITKHDNSNGYYLLKSNISNIKRIVDIAIKNRVITFSYDVKNFTQGALISLLIEDEATIYMNKKMLKKYSIQFNPTLFQIVRFYNVEQ